MADILEIVREEDFVEYFIYPVIEQSSESDFHNLQHALSQISSVINPFLESYIWHKDEFQLKVRPLNFKHLIASTDKHEELLPPHLYGILHYGDNIEDEWFIVFLLLELTKNIPGLIARVVDFDGEFLLIEAAEFLPRWAVPEKCEGHVFLYGGEVHLVPPETGKSFTTAELLEQIRSHPEWTRASQSVQDSIKRRLEGYPGKMTTFHHTDHAVLPVAVAALLEANPSLISPAVLAFCHRDPIDIKVCRLMKNFPPKPAVMRSVKFTKCLYAMVTQQNFMPDKRSGWSLPPSSTPEFKSILLGAKIASGFEILVSQVKKSWKNKNDLSIDKGWHLFKEKLKSYGYFKDLLEGSKEYSALENVAQDYYLEMENVSLPVTGQRILDLLENLKIDEGRMKDEEKNLPPPDDDSWLNISPEELEAILKARFGVKNQMVNVTDDPKQITSKLMAFFNKRSEFDGVEDESQDDLDSASSSTETTPMRPPRKNKGKSSNSAHNVNGASNVSNESSEALISSQIHFDQEAFACALQNVLDLVVPEDDWDLESNSSGMSSYEDELEMIEKSSIKPDTSVSELKQYMDQMDKELASSTIGQSFEKSVLSEYTEEDSFSDIESFKPVDIDVNALKNMIKSYEEQIGGPGPTSNLLGSAGLQLDVNSKKSDP